MTDPFRYSPHPLVIEAGIKTVERITQSPELDKEFSKGKMIGVLIYKDPKSPTGTGHIAAFSGNIDGKNMIEGFVPPIYDLLDPDGHFKKGEAELDRLNRNIESLEASSEYKTLKERLQEVRKSSEEELSAMRSRMSESKLERDRIRSESNDTSGLEQLIRQSQFEKAELRRRKIEWNSLIDNISSKIEAYQATIRKMKKERAEKSDLLQKWIFSQFMVHNACGEYRSIGEIFEEEGLTPPGGTGECAGPKLLEHAYRNGLEPLAMGEFWYGRDSETAVRAHGHFYPSCTSKCGPLLKFMMKGLAIDKEAQPLAQPSIIHMDNSIMIVSKPSGMPSVSGLNGIRSVEEELAPYGAIPVHRLDMDTSGIMIFARNETAAENLRRQFEDHTVRKTYLARLQPSAGCSSILNNGDKGEIRLPLSPDYDERPRQKVDKVQGKEALTTYRIISTNPDGSIEIELHPYTGRTHQLRVHCAHPQGLARPISGDKLYGGCSSLHAETTASRLCLHALRISFRHPESGKEITFESQDHSFYK